MLSSCVFENLSIADCEPDGPNGTTEGNFSISFKIKTLSNQSRAVSEDFEKISYLRIIILNDGKLESNRLIELPQTISSSSLEYEYKFESAPGQKSFFLIGNEQSVENISFSVPLTELPSGLQKYIADNSEGGLSLSDLLVYYTKNDEGKFPDSDNEADIDEFASVMNAVYFNPDYSKDSNGNYYLPYTAYYGGEGYNITQDTILDEMYLIPVATKFTFNFVNWREENVVVNGIKISDFNNEVTFDEISESFVSSEGTVNLGAICDSSFLMGQIGEDEIWKPFDDLRLYWISWMQRVAELTQNNPSSSVEINKRYGWIEKYSIPDYTKLSNVNNIVEHFYPDRGEWLVYGTVLTPGGQAGTLSLGPYYVPESRHIIEYTNEYFDESTNQVVTQTLSRQAYYLSLDMNQVGTNLKPDFTVVEIDNLHSLFRGTSVVITINMKKGEYGVYAEIAPWTNNKSYGYVTEHPEDE